MWVDCVALPPTPDLVDFTDEESYGRYLDLHQLYDCFINLKGVEKVDYLTYLGSFDRLFEIHRDKKNSEYKRWVRVSLPVVSNSHLKQFVSEAHLLKELNSSYRMQFFFLKLDLPNTSYD